MMMPAGPNEVFRRLMEMEERVQQLRRRKTENVRRHLGEVLEWAGIAAAVAGD